MFLKTPVYLPAIDEFLITDAKSSRWLQEPEKLLNYSKQNPRQSFYKRIFICWLIIAINFEQRDVIVLSIRHFYITTKIIKKVKMINIIFIFGLTFQSPKWTLENKSEYIVEHNVDHLVIFQKCICFYQYYLQSKFMPELIFSKKLSKFLFSHFNNVTS